MGVDRHLCGAQQTGGFDPMLFQYCPPPHQRPWTNIETTLGQVLVFPERAVRILIQRAVCVWLEQCYVYLLVYQR